MHDEHPNVLYVTSVILEDHTGDEWRILTWRTPQQIEQIIDATDEEDFVRLEDADGQLHRKRKETIKAYSVSREIVQSVRRTRKPVRPKESIELKKEAKKPVDKKTI